MKVKESQRKFSCGPVTCYKVNLSLTINYYSESTWLIQTSIFGFQLIPRQFNYRARRVGCIHNEFCFKVIKNEPLLIWKRIVVCFENDVFCSHLFVNEFSNFRGGFWGCQHHRVVINVCFSLKLIVNFMFDYSATKTGDFHFLKPFWPVIVVYK